jgi:hypothetical protein
MSRLPRLGPKDRRTIVSSPNLVGGDGSLDSGFVYGSLIATFLGSEAYGAMEPCSRYHPFSRRPLYSAAESMIVLCMCIS